MLIRFVSVLLSVLAVGACETATSGVATTPSAVMTAGAGAASGTSASNATGTAAAAAGRPWKATLVWKVTGIVWANGGMGQGTSNFGGRCSAPSDYVISATFEGEATHAGHVTGTTEHCSQLIWSPQGPIGATYSDGRGSLVSANRSTLVLQYGQGITGVDAATGESWFHDNWTFAGGTGLFDGASGAGEEGGRFMDFGALLSGAPVSMWMEGTITYNPGRSKKQAEGPSRVSGK